MTPTDDLVFIGDPPLEAFRPKADEVHISVSFTWDVDEGQRLRKAWSQYYESVKIGGPAFNTPCNGFTPGLYIKNGVTFTTRGCNNFCPWCRVWMAEGELVEYKHFAPGYIVQDNNFLQASWSHKIAVFDMLKHQPRAAIFSGGLQASLVTDAVADELRGLRIYQVFLAADTEGAIRPLERALNKLSFLKRDKLRVYMMIGYGNETLSKAEERLRKVWELGGLPFAQLYQPENEFIKYSTEWRDLARNWSRPAIMKTIMQPSNDTKPCPVPDPPPPPTSAPGRTSRATGCWQRPEKGMYDV